MTCTVLTENGPKEYPVFPSDEEREEYYKDLFRNSTHLQSLLYNLINSNFLEPSTREDFECCIDEIGNHKIIASRVDYVHKFTVWTKDHVVFVTESNAYYLDWEFRNPNVKGSK